MPRPGIGPGKPVPKGRKRHVATSPGHGQPEFHRGGSGPRTKSRAPAAFTSRGIKEGEERLENKPLPHHYYITLCLTMSNFHAFVVVRPHLGIELLLDFLDGDVRLG